MQMQEVQVVPVGLGLVLELVLELVQVRALVQVLQVWASA